MKKLNIYLSITIIFLSLLSKPSVADEIWLSEKEKAYIAAHPIIRLAGGDAYEPFVIQNLDGTISGHDKEILDHITEQTGLKFHITLGEWSLMQKRAIDREYDGLVSAGHDRSRELHFNASLPYLKFQTLVITKKDGPNKLLSPRDLDNKRVGIERGNLLFNRIIDELDQDVTKVSVASIEDMIKSVVSGEVDFIVLDESVFYVAKQIGLASLIEVGFTVGKPFDIMFWFRDDHPELTSIVNKALSSMRADEKVYLREKWFSDSYEQRLYETLITLFKSIDYLFIAKVATLLVLLFLFLLYRQKMLTRSNLELTRQVALEVEKYKTRDNLIFHNNKMASLGEMIVNIAHQWKQPLSELSLNENILLAKLKKKDLSESELMEKIKDQQEIIRFMSQTIDTFQRFYEKDDEKVEFLIYENLKSVRFMLDETLTLNNISIDEENIDHAIAIYGKRNAFSQVVLAVLQNSVYFLIHRKVEDPMITLDLYQKEHTIYLSIEDNALGIDESVIDKVFEYGFSDKEDDDHATGIGLYMAKIIIQEKFDGKIKIENSKDGALCTISLRA